MTKTKVTVTLTREVCLVKHRCWESRADDCLVLGTQFPSVLSISIPRLLTVSGPKWLHTMSHSRHLAGKCTCTLARAEAHGHTWLQGRLGNAVFSWVAMNLAKIQEFYCRK